MKNGAQTITSIKFEPSFVCSSEFLVAGQDYTVIEYEVAGSNSTYPLNDAFSGPQFYFTTTTSNNAISPCSGFDLGTNACTDRTGEPNSCSCFEIISGSFYRLSLNLTADLTFSRQALWLVWPGPPPIPSENHTLPEVRAGSALGLVL
ncbi:hypothetical protein RRG08_063647 [Elysia crispata]|uniref:Uncharacterized protein n=1 Tax=Elysia crispata TaxID=231223 RepID=A0AAE0Y7M7_9GAST|nr:hypothetical protein RRG08_063647 [Elysia crispata]